MAIELEAIRDSGIKEKMPKRLPILDVLALNIIIRSQLISLIHSSHKIIIIINKLWNQKLFNKIITEYLSGNSYINSYFRRASALSENLRYPIRNSTYKEYYILILPSCL